MRKSACDKLESYSGYIGTKQLLKAGITNRQIGALVAEGLLEKICHGSYWVNKEAYRKPKEYKAIEVCISDPKAVICADSACFYLGLISTEPTVLSAATSRQDRRAIKMNFPVRRYYFSESNFEEVHQIVTTDFGSYQTFDLDRSVCDCIRFRKSIDTYLFDLIIDAYRERKDEQEKRLWAYARKLHVLNEVQKYL